MAQYLKDSGVAFRKGGLNLVGGGSKVPALLPRSGYVLRMLWPLQR